MLSASLPGCLSASLPGCLSASLPGCLSASLPGCLSASLPGCLSASLPGGLALIKSRFLGEKMFAKFPVHMFFASHMDYIGIFLVNVKKY